MQEPKIVLVATDFSPHGVQAVDIAIDLAKRFGAALHVAHVFAPPLPFVAPYDLPPPDLYMDQARKECQEQLANCSKRAESEGVNAETHLLNGATSQEICRFAEELGSDLLVVGSRGLTGLKHMLLGSVAERIVRHAPCSVYIARSSDLDTN